MEAVGSRYSRRVWAAPLLFEAGIKQMEEDPPADEELLLQELPHVSVSCRSIRSAEEEEQLPASGEGQEGPAGEEGAESDGRSRQVGAPPTPLCQALR